MRILFCAATLLCATAVHATPFSINLGAASPYAALAGSTVTNTGTTSILGSVGVSPGTAITGFGTATVTGGTIHAGDAGAAQAEAALGTAYAMAAGAACGTTLTGQDLGGMTLLPGSYCFASSAQLTGTLTLNAQGNADALFLFQIGSTLTTSTEAAIDLIGGAQGADLFWQVGSSATLGTATNFAGNILAYSSITVNTGASISCGRALAENGAVTLDSNTVSTCNGSSPSQEVPEPSTALLLAAAAAFMLVAPAVKTTRRRAECAAGAVPLAA